MYESLFNNNRDAVIFFNETTIVNANKSALDLFEVDPDEFIGHEIYEFKLDKEKANKRAERRLQGVSESFTTEIKTPKGVKEIEVYSTAVNIENITSYSIIRDITERKNLEQRFRVIFEHSRDLIFITSKDAVEFINPRGVEYLGYSSPTEIIGKHPTELIHPDYRELATRHATMRRSGGTPPNQYRAKMITKNGVAKPVEFNASFIEWDGKPASLTIARDISKQVELEEELRHSRQILTDFTESATDAFSILDEDLRFIMVNETELEYSGLEREDYIGKHMLEVFPGLKDTGRYAGYQRVLETGDPVNYPEVTTRNGEHIINYTAFKAGDYLGILGRDITEQKRLEEEKERAYAELAVIYDSSPIIMILVDEDRRVRAANHVSSKFAQRHIEEMRGLRGGEALRCIHHLDSPKGCGYGEACEECTIRNLVLDTHKTGTKHDQVETSLTVSQGEENKSMNLLVSTAPILVESESLVLVSIQDITELKQKEKELRRANQVYQAFNKGFREILRNDSFEKTARTLFNDLTELIDAKSGYVALLSDDGSENELLFLESGGLPCTVDPDLPMPIRGLREKAYESGKGVYENSFHNSEWQRYLPEGHVKLNNVLFAPLNIEKKTVGIIGIANKSTDFTDEDLELAESFGELAAIALKHTRFLKDIQESRERLSAFMESAADGFVLLDEDLNVQLVNQVWVDQAGLKKEKVLNRHIADIFPYIIEAGRLDVYKEVLRTGESRELQHCDHPGGKETWFNIRVFKVGEGLGLITRDITKEVKYRQQLETLHKHTVILQNADNEAEIVEKTYHILVESLGYETVDIIKCEDGKLIDVHTTTPETYEIPVTGAGITAKAFRLAESQLVQDTSKDPDYILGTYEARHRSELVVPILVEEEVKFLINIESEKPYSLTLEDKKLVELLAGHIGSQLASLKLESERIRANLAEEMEEMKTSFIRTATHELRTPLTSMKGFLELAMSEKNLDSIQQYLEIAYRNTDRLEALTNDLLDQQRLEDSRMNIDLETINLTRLVSHVVDELAGVLGEKNQIIEVNIPDMIIVEGDALRLEQVLVNLLDNASKYSLEGSTIYLSAKVSDGTVQVSIRDEGIGLTEEEIEKLFIPFPDIDRPTVTEQSVGLGLSICKGIIDLHGGKIWAESPGRDEGSTFIFTLPRREKDE